MHHQARPKLAKPMQAIFLHKIVYKVLTVHKLLKANKKGGPFGPPSSKQFVSWLSLQQKQKHGRLCLWKT